MKKLHYRRFHRSLNRPNRRFHSLLIRIIRYLNLRHGSDRVWSLERIRLGRWKGWDHKVVTPQFTFVWTWKDEVIRKTREEYEKAVASAVAAGSQPPLPEPEQVDSCQPIFGTPWGGNVGWPRWSDDRVMTLLKEGFFSTFSDHPVWWQRELSYFPFNSTFSSVEDLAFKMEINCV